jgi:hypothetical protein
MLLPSRVLKWPNTYLGSRDVVRVGNLHHVLGGITWLQGSLSLQQWAAMRCVS